MFLFRTLFWLSLVVLVLPTDSQQQDKLYKSVSQAAHQAATFCDRNANACERGSQLWATFKQKLEFGARMAMDVVAERMQDKAQSPKKSLQPAGGTLTPADLAPAWRGKRTGA